MESRGTAYSLVLSVALEYLIIVGSIPNGASTMM